MAKTPKLLQWPQTDTERLARMLDSGKSWRLIEAEMRRTSEKKGYVSMSRRALKRTLLRITKPRPEPPQLKRHRLKSQPTAETGERGENVTGTPKSQERILKPLRESAAAARIRTVDYLDAARLRIIQRIEKMLSDIDKEEPRQCSKCGGYETNHQRAETRSCLMDIKSIIGDMDKALGRGREAQALVHVNAPPGSEVVLLTTDKYTPEELEEIARVQRTAKPPG
jgi:hypothetical protein